MTLESSKKTRKKNTSKRLEKSNQTKLRKAKSDTNAEKKLYKQEQKYYSNCIDNC